MTQTLSVGPEMVDALKERSHQRTTDQVEKVTATNILFPAKHPQQDLDKDQNNTTATALERRTSGRVLQADATKK